MRQIAILFIMMGCGYFLVRCKLLKSEDSRVLSVILIYIVLPCVIIRAFQIDFTPEVRDGFMMALAAAVLIHLILLIINWIMKRTLGLSVIERASVIYSNAGNLVIPLVTSMLGSEWVIYASPFMCCQLCVVWTYGVSEIRGGDRIEWKRILLNINLICVVIGIVMLVTGLRLPSMVVSAMGDISAIVGPVSMFMVGMLFAGKNIKDIISNGRLWMVCALKMLVIPLLALGVLTLTHLYDLVENGRTVLYICYLAVMTPTASTVAQLAQLYNREPEYAGEINVLTTLLCIVTMPLMTWLYNILI